MKNIIFLIVFTLLSTLCFSQDPTVYITNGGTSYTVIEGNTYEFSISLYSVATSNVVVNVSTITDTADASDYTPLNTTVTIPAGQLSSNTLTIPTGNDSTVESTENFIIQATVTSGNTENSDISRSIFLYDNDATPTINISTITSLVEGQGYNYSVSLSNYYSSDVSIDFNTTSGTADPSDYISTSTSITIPAGERYAQFPIITTDDALTEVDETYTITATVTTGNATNNTITITVTIIDNDTIPSFSISSYGTIEGNTATLYTRLNRVYNSNVIIQINTSNGTADNSDYTSINQSYIIPAGNTSNNIQILTNDDALDEPEEFFNITATVTSGNTTNTSETEAITIIDNDGLPDFYISVPYDPNVQTSDSLVAEEGYDLKFYPRLTHTSPLDTDIVITTTNGSADNSDYTTSTLNMTIPAGQTYVYNEIYSYPTILDQIEEADENLFVNALVTSANTYNATYTEEAFILDNYEINAQPDEIISVLEVGTTFQVLDNDTYHGLPVVPSDLNISLIGTNTIGATLSPSGILTVPASTPQGYYYIPYEICESANPTSCDSAFITVIVESPLDVTSVVTYVDFNADGYTSVGDLIEFEYTVTNNGNAVITDIDADVIAIDLNIIGGPLASLGVGETDTTTFTATHIITQDDINFGYFGGDQEGVYFHGTYYGSDVQDFVYDGTAFQLQRSDGLKLNAFVDTNGNGTQETGEVNFPLGQFDYEINNDGVIHNLYVSPHYLYESNPTTTYNLSYTVDSDYAGNNTTTSYSNVTVPVGSEITTYDFPITVTPYDDLSVNLSTFGVNPVPVPGFSYGNTISYTNNSNEVVPSATIDFTMDAALSLIGVYEISQNWFSYNNAPITTTATGFSYNLTNLQPYETRRLWIRMYVPTLPTVDLGQLVTNSVDIELLSADILPLNNTSSLTQTIVGSYDPNDVTERHGPEIIHSEFTTDDYLTYTIRFENTGTANAINIKVTDVLDAQLDETTLKMVDASHEYTLERVGRDLEWNFFGINLPPSEDSEGSTIGHGYLIFKIKPFPDYELGDIIPNTAEIYFDFNPAIVTNTWTTEFVEDNLSVINFTFEGLKVHPIPAKNEIFVENNSVIDSIEITSILGQSILAKKINDTKANIDLSEVTSGIYFLTVSSKEHSETIKIVKE